MALCWTIGCGGLVDPDDPDELSAVLVIPGAERIDGDPPSPSGTADAPVVEGGDSINVDSGDQAQLRLTYESDTGYDDCYVQVVGASDYFRVPVGNTNTSGEIVIPVEVSEDVASGSFDLYTCIAGANGSVSNPLTNSIAVTNLDEEDDDDENEETYNGYSITSSCFQAIESAKQQYASISNNNCQTNCANNYYDCFASTNCTDINSCADTLTGCLGRCN